MVVLICHSKYSASFAVGMPTMCKTKCSDIFHVNRSVCAGTILSRAIVCTHLNCLPVAAESVENGFSHRLHKSTRLKLFFPPLFKYSKLDNVDVMTLFVRSLAMIMSPGVESVKQKTHTHTHKVFKRISIKR